MQIGGGGAGSTVGSQRSAMQSGSSALVLGSVSTIFSSMQRWSTSNLVAEPILFTASL
jgi:hypothetical protein